MIIEPCIDDRSTDPTRCKCRHRALLKAEADAKRAAVKAAADAEAMKAAQAAAKIAANCYALTNLLDDDCDHLETLGRRSHNDARNIFRHHVEDAWPEVAALPVDDATADPSANLMRKRHGRRQGPHSQQVAQLHPRRIPDGSCCEVESQHPAEVHELRRGAQPGGRH
jgi:hypothetical protein